MISIETKHALVKTAFQKMLKEGTFFVTTVTACAELLGVVPDREALTALRLLHCMRFEEIPENLRAEMPNLFSRCLQCDYWEFFTVKVETTVRTVDDEYPKPPTGILRILKSFGGKS